MPQFDLTTYSSQIFWLTICFALLYICVSKIILPRIANIIKERTDSIQSNNSVAGDLNKKIQTLEAQIKKVRKEASNQYQTKLEEASKLASDKRTSAIEALKNKIDQDTKKSRQAIKDFVENESSKNEALTKDLENKITEKLFGTDLAKTL